MIKEQIHEPKEPWAAIRPVIPSPYKSVTCVYMQSRNLHLSDDTRQYRGVVQWYRSGVIGLLVILVIFNVCLAQRKCILYFFYMTPLRSRICTAVGYIPTALYFFSLENYNYLNRNDRLVPMSLKFKRNFKKIFLLPQIIEKTKIYLDNFDNGKRAN